MHINLVGYAIQTSTETKVAQDVFVFLQMPLLHTVAITSHVILGIKDPVNLVLLKFHIIRQSKKKYPKNAHSDGSGGWICDAFYVRSGSKCVLDKDQAKQIPINAYASNSTYVGWRCNNGYFKLGKKLFKNFLQMELHGLLEMALGVTMNITKKVINAEKCL